MFPRAEMLPVMGAPFPEADAWDHTAGRALAFLACILAAVLGALALGHSHAVLSEDFYFHTAHAEAFARQFLAHKHPFCFWTAGLGVPLWSAYPPLHALIAGGLRAVFPLLGAVVWVWLSTVVLWSAFPLALYRCLRSLDLPALTAGGASLFCLLFFNPWGHSLEAYTLIGLQAQLLGYVLFCLAFSALHRCLWHKGSWAWAALGTGLLLLAHPIAAFFLCWVAILEVLILLSRKGRRSAWPVLKLFLVFVFALAIGCLWVWPAIAYSQFHLVIPQPELYRFTGLWQSPSVPALLHSWFLGALFEGVALPETWIQLGPAFLQPTLSEGRWPVLTGMAVLGLVYYLCRPGEWETGEVMVLSLLCVSLALILGADEIPGMNRVPMWGELMQWRAVFLLQIGTAVLAASVVTALTRWVREFFYRETVNPMVARTREGIVLCLTLILVLSAPALYERLRTARELGQRDAEQFMEAVTGELLQIRAENPGARVLYEARSPGLEDLATLSGLSHPKARGSSSASNWGGTPKFWWPDNAAEEHPWILDLYGVTHLGGLSAPGTFLLDRLALTQRSVPASLADPLWASPVLVLSNLRDWYELSHSWFMWAMREGGYRQVWPLVRLSPRPRDFETWIEGGKVRALVLLEPGQFGIESPFWRTLLQRCADKGISVYSNQNLRLSSYTALEPGLPSVPGLWRELGPLPQELDDVAVPQVQWVNVGGGGRHSMLSKAPEGGAAFLKMTADPGWQIRVNERRAVIGMLAPGFPVWMLPQGESVTHCQWVASYDFQRLATVSAGALGSVFVWILLAGGVSLWRGRKK
ncbi:MAG: hypothetical protein JW937_05045 [Candidatus Omnitrophica bacterium]|nr:hypothetical protein [Candidatus Omnitrophota bacterium]